MGVNLNTQNFEHQQVKIAELESITRLREELSKIANVSDPLEREYKLLLFEEEAEQYGLSKQSYRRLFEAYSQSKKHIPESSKGWWNRRKIQLNFIGKAFSLTLEKGFLVVAIIGLAIYIWEAPQRQKQTHYQDWQIINFAAGQQGSGGRIEALEDLNNDGVSLNGLTAKGANLSGIQLQKADLRFANIQNSNLGCRGQQANIQMRICSNLQGANLVGVNFRAANLVGANLQAADLENANLEGVNLIKANLKAANLFGTNIQAARLLFTNLQEANLLEANLQASQLQGANFQKVNLLGANLKATNLKEANFQAANLQATNLQGANLKNANLQGADLQGADLQGAKELTPEQVKTAKNWDKANYDPEFRRKLGLISQVPRKRKLGNS